MNRHHTMLQDIHPLTTTTTIPHPSITLHSNTENNHSYQDANTIDFISNDGLSFVPPISQASPIYEFEDLDYQSGLTSYQKNHMAFRHPSMTTSTPMNIHQQPSMPINIKTEPISNYTLYNHNNDNNFSPDNHHHHHHHQDETNNTFPMSAPANIGQHSFDISTSDGFHFNHHHPHHPQHHVQALSTSPHASTVYQQQPQHPRSLDGTQSPGSQPRSFEDDYSIQVNMQAMMDKRRRRRESHNAVERRRRENINERIQELGTLLPDVMTDSTKPNKGAILRKSVDHIRQLQQELSTYSQRIKELEETLKKLQTK